MNPISWEEALRELHVAVDRLLIGDPAPYQELWSHAADVTMMGAYGGLAIGHEAVCTAITRAADNYSGWRPDYMEEPIAAENDGSLGYLILRERVSNQNDKTVRYRRVTVLFRRETNRWRIFHHHSDPLYDRESS
jgi:ketosteroid isomerase-like protein